jgi:hypothetical protein
MHTHLVLLSSLLALSSAGCAVDSHPISEVPIHQNNLIPRDPHAMNIEGWATKANRVIPTWPRVARATQSSAICGPHFYDSFIKFRPELPCKPLKQRARRCKRYCKCETVPGYNNKELTCQRDLERECRKFCVCEAPGPDYYRKGIWGHEIASTEGWESSSADKAMNEARMEEVRSRSSSSGHKSADGETDEVSSRSSWETLDGDSSESRRMTANSNYVNIQLQADAATRSGRIRLGQRKSKHGKP